MPEVIIAADLGPNPAPICELVWALDRQRQLHTQALHLLSTAHSERYTDELRHGLGLLGEVLGGIEGSSALPWSQVHLHRVRDAAGARVEDELRPADVDAWNQARWENYRRAQRAAGPRAVVFGLVGGRRRTMGALTAAMYQLLARPQDLCIDVRVSEPRVEGARAGFFFPEQPSVCADERGLIDPRQVRVMLVELKLPKLRGLLRQHDLRTFDQALAATGVSLDQAAIPKLHIDLPAGRVSINGQAVALSDSQAIWYAALALTRSASSSGAREAGGGWVASTDHDEPLRRIMKAWAATRTLWVPRSPRLRTIWQGQALPHDELRKLKADTARRLREHCREHQLVRQDLVIPQKTRPKGQVWRQRIALEPEHISLLL